MYEKLNKRRTRISFCRPPSVQFNYLLWLDKWLIQRRYGLKACKIWVFKRQFLRPTVSDLSWNSTELKVQPEKTYNTVLFKDFLTF